MSPSLLIKWTSWCRPDSSTSEIEEESSGVQGHPPLQRSLRPAWARCCLQLWGCHSVLSSSIAPNRTWVLKTLRTRWPRPPCRPGDPRAGFNCPLDFRLCSPSPEWCPMASHSPTPTPRRCTVSPTSSSGPNPNPTDVMVSLHCQPNLLILEPSGTHASKGVGGLFTEMIDWIGAVPLQGLHPKLKEKQEVR